jgi:hypothetical protein
MAARRLAIGDWRLADRDRLRANQPAANRQPPTNMPSLIHLDATSLSAWINRLLAGAAKRTVTSIAIQTVNGRVRLTLSGVNTGLKVFGMDVPPIDADLLLLGSWSGQKLQLTWELEAIRGVPPMAAKLLGKPMLAKLLRDQLGTRWGLDRALTAEPSGDFVLDPSFLALPGCAGLKIHSLELSGADDYVVKMTAAWT